MLFRQCCSLRHGLVFQFSAGLKIENCSQFSIFVFSAKTFQIVDRTTQEGEGGVYSHVNFLPLAPSPQIPFPPCEFFFFAPDPLPLLPPSTPLFSGEEEAGNSYLQRSHFSKHERLQCWVHKGSCNNSKKNRLRGELIAKRKISRQERPRSVKRFCLENGKHLHICLSNDELEQCMRDVVARVSISLLDLSACCSLFSSFFYLHFFVCIAVYMSTLQGSKWFFSFNVNL